MMANVSSSNGLEKYPKLRFPGYDEPWEICTAEELFQNVTDKNHLDETVLTIVQGKGTLPREQAGRNIHYDDASLSNYKMVQKGDFIIHLRSFEGGLEMANENGIVSPAYTILRGKKPHSSRFYEAYFHTDEFVNHVLSKSVEGIRDGRQISYDAFKWLGLPYCSPSEQAKIAELFSVLTKRIETQTVLVDSLKKYKRGAVRHLLSAKSCPLRNARWTTAKMGELGSFVKGVPLSKADISEDGTPFILYGELYTTYNEVVTSIKRRTKAQVDETFLSRVRDVVIPTSGETPEEISTASCVMLPNVILAGDLYIFRGDKVDGRIMSYLLNHVVNAKIARIAQGKSVVHIQASELCKLTLTYPDKNTQNTIIKFLSKLDDKITNAEKALTFLSELKEGLMQQLFI